jgi:hypothetical protein
MITLSIWAKAKKGHKRETTNIGKIFFAIMKKPLRKLSLTGKLLEKDVTKFLKGKGSLESYNGLSTSIRKYLEEYSSGP